jgi:hypothetical protein
LEFKTDPQILLLRVRTRPQDLVVYLQCQQIPTEKSKGAFNPLALRRSARASKSGCYHHCSSCEDERYRRGDFWDNLYWGAGAKKANLFLLIRLSEFLILYHRIGRFVAGK